MKLLTTLILLVGLLLGDCLPAAAQSVSYGKRKTVQLNAVADHTNNKITLLWNVYLTADSFEVYRMSSSGTWPSTPLATLDSTASSYVDSGLNQNQVYEYKVIAKRATYPGFGYVASAIKLAEKTQKGTILVVVDSLLRDSIADALAVYEQDLTGDGYSVLIRSFDTAHPAEVLKDSINNYYSAYSDLQTVFLVGALPYAYTGSISPDGHYDHRGAWPSDMIYADVDASYTDAVVNYTNTFDSRHTNSTSDTKYDQSYLLSNAELRVGRLDLSRLSAFSQDEYTLYRNYFSKLHSFKSGAFKPRQIGLVDDNFTGYTEGFSQNGYRNFSPLTHIDSVLDCDIITNLQNGSALWSYACGGGSFTSITGFTTTAGLSSNSLGGVFSMVLGSYTADVDVTNNLMRSMLANGNFLTAGWAGRPNWFVQHMGLGYTIGNSTRISQNNTDAAYEPEGNYARMMHVMLLGDPTLKNHYTPNVTDLSTIRTQNKDTALLSWTAVSGSDGYRIYRSKDAAGPYTLLTSSAITTNSYADPISSDTSYFYRVVTTELVQNMSGSYYERSIGEQILSDKNAAPLPVTLLTFKGTKRNDDIQLDWSVADEVNFSHYIVEKRNELNGQWEELGQVQANGDPYSITDYRMIDPRPVLGINVYRLKMVDMDASFEFSPLVVVQFDDRLQAGNFRITPTLAYDRISLSSETATTNMQRAYLLMDGNGRVLDRYETHSPVLEIDIRTLPAGMYFIRDLARSGVTKRFVKTN